MKISKRLKEAKSKVDPKKVYTVDEALVLMKETSKVKFDASLRGSLTPWSDSQQANLKGGTYGN
jgi:ribosomal protein L1